MKFYIIFALALMALGSLAEKINGRQSFILPLDSRLRRMDIEQLLRKQNNYWVDGDDEQLAGNLQKKLRYSYVPSEALIQDSSNGRLFLKKFFLMGSGKQNQQEQPQIIIIRPRPVPSRPTNPIASTSTSTNPITSTATTDGTVTISEVDARGGDDSDDYIAGEEDMYDDDDETINEKSNTFKLVKGKRTQQGLNFVVPSNYMRFFQNNGNALAVNPSATYNNISLGVNKRKIFRRPVRRFISQN